MLSYTIFCVIRRHMDFRVIIRYTINYVGEVMADDSESYTAKVSDATQLAQLLRQARLLSGQSQARLAERIGVDQQTIAAIESGEPTKYAQRLFLILGATGAELRISIPRTARARG
jgi:HTH-type transcriptional regulator/antitoxin HipB